MAAEHYPFGYCTNVHAGISLSEAQSNLEKVACAVRDKLGERIHLPVGLWLAEHAAAELASGEAVAKFGEWLHARRLIPYTFNGFPQGDFHQAVVKQAVYEPDWRSQRRVEYTKRLATIMSGLLPLGSNGSISTLPLGWPATPWTNADYQQAADNLLEVARHLRELLDQQGTEIVLAIEPEPGCVIDTAEGLTDFFDRYLLRGKEAGIARRHLTVCHDVCHSAVMFESQAAVLDCYASHGIRIGKVQVSSAVAASWKGASPEDRAALRVAVIDELRQFSEPRYLHQTTRCVYGPGDSPADRLKRILGQPDELDLIEDLPFALSQWADHDEGEDEWRVHFHVPIFVDKFGHLRGTRDDIRTVVEELKARSELKINDRAWFTGHYEVETYAWGVLPEDLRNADLADGITRELRYLESLMA